MIVAAAVTSNASDQGQMLPRLDEVKAAYGESPERVLADAGYCNELDLASLEERGVDGLCGLGPGGQQSGGGQRQGASGAGADGQEAGGARRSGAVRQAQVAVGSAQRLDQAGAGFSPLQRARP